MTEGSAIDAQRDDLTDASGSFELDPRETVPWVDGRLLGFFSAGDVLDIKPSDDPDRGPVVAGATVVFLRGTADGAAPSGWGHPEEDVGERSFLTVFSRDALGRAADPAATLVSWFGLLADGGNLILVLPADDRMDVPATEVRATDASDLTQAMAIPAPLHAPPRPTIRDAALMRIVDASLPAGRFRVVLLDRGPARRSDPDRAAVDLRLVLRKLPAPGNVEAEASGAPVTAEPQHNVADLSLPFTEILPNPVKTPGMRCENGLLVRDFASQRDKVTRIVVLKLDHHGDFIIALPALGELRGNHPEAYIRLVCGSWNVSSAVSTGLFDDVRSFDYFTERAVEWTGVPASIGWSLFDKAVEGVFDLAIDLRVDDDTRALLARVDARLRCGIGSIARFPLLDVALPDSAREPTRIALSPLGNFSLTPDGSQVLLPGDFLSCMDLKAAAYHETSFRPSAGPLLRSPMFFLPEGSYSVAFNLSARAFVPGIRGTGVKIEVVEDSGKVIAAKVFGRRSISGIGADVAVLRFESSGRPSTYGFLVTTEGRPLMGRLRFGGVRLRRHDANGARFSPSELHVGEKLSLLVALIRQRTRRLYPLPDAGLPAAPEPERTITFVVSPFSNSTIRDWPSASYARLIELLSTSFACRVIVVGSPAQVRQAADLMARLDGSGDRANVVNMVGRTEWSELRGVLRSADLVICNNSGTGHQAAQMGVRTLAIYSASHQPSEWGPRGESSRAIMASVACSPCGYERIADCVNDHLCMRLITPEAVAAQVEAMLAVDEAPSS